MVVDIGRRCKPWPRALTPWRRPDLGQAAGCGWQSAVRINRDALDPQQRQDRAPTWAIRCLRWSRRWCVSVCDGLRRHQVARSSPEILPTASLRVQVVVPAAGVLHEELPVAYLPLLHALHLVVDEEQSPDPILRVHRRRRNERYGANLIEEPVRGRLADGPAVEDADIAVRLGEGRPASTVEPVVVAVVVRRVLRSLGRGYPSMR